MDEGEPTGFTTSKQRCPLSPNGIERPRGVALKLKPLFTVVTCAEMPPSSLSEEAAKNSRPSPLTTSNDDGGGDATARSLIVLGRTRCRDSAGYLATVVFDGVVPSKKGPRRYWGVVWDDPSRGKHNGSLVDAQTGHLVQYFTAPHPTGGSFVLPHKVDLGRPLGCRVLQERYPREPQEWEQHQVRCTGGPVGAAHKPIEFVGNEKIVSQQQLETLTTVSLRFMGINRVPLESSLNDPDSRFSQLLTSCTHMDLAGNLLTDWMDVKRLLLAMPMLEHVSVAHNRFVDCTLLLAHSEECENPVAAADPAAVFWSKSLRRLNLRKCNISSSRCLIVLGRLLPSLESLCCAFTRFDDLEGAVADQVVKNQSDRYSVPPFPRVRALDATSCGLTQEQIPCLSSLFPAVADLNLSDNPIEMWPQNVFMRLTHLQWTLPLPAFTEAKLSELSVILKKSLQPLVSHHGDRLVSLRLDTPPSAPPIPTGFKLQLIACLGRLTCWNSSLISKLERSDAEKYYLRNCRAPHAYDPSTAASAVLENPCLDELLESHPQLRSPGTSGEGTSASASSPEGASAAMALVTVELRSLCAHSCERPPIVRKLPLQLTLGRLKALLSKHFDMDVDLQALSWVTSQSTGSSSRENASRGQLPVPMEGEDETTTLEDCGLINGAIVFMNEREIRNTTEQRERMQRIQQQEDELEHFERRKRYVVGCAMPTRAALPHSGVLECQSNNS